MLTSKTVHCSYVQSYLISHQLIWNMKSAYMKGNL